MRRLRARRLVASSELAVFAIESVVATVRRSAAGCLVYGRVEPVAVVVRRPYPGGENGGRKGGNGGLEIRPLPMDDGHAAGPVDAAACRALIAEIERDPPGVPVEH